MRREIGKNNGLESNGCLGVGKVEEGEEEEEEEEEEEKEEEEEEER